jgi:hypothetical protein
LFFIDDELNCYLDNTRTPQALPKVDPFQWWIDHELKFPVLFKLARKYLSIQATSVGFLVMLEIKLLVIETD